MNEIKLITEENIKDISISKIYDWDVVLNGRPYYVARIDGYVHRIGGKYGNNDLWAFPRNEAPTVENLIEFDCDNPVSWSISYESKNIIRCKWNETESYSIGVITIYRNGKEFYSFRGSIGNGIDKGRCMIEEYKEHPLNLQKIDFDKKMIGRKVWWRSEPAKIESFVEGQASVILVPDGIKEFKVPEEFKSDDMFDNEEDKEFIKTSILDEHIWWFRD